MSTMNAIIVHAHSLLDVAISEVSDHTLKKLQDVPALSSAACEPVTAELGDGNPIHLHFYGLETHHLQHYFDT